MIRTIIFDYDGVLVESLDIKAEAFRALFRKESVERTDAIVQYHLEHAGVSRFEKIRYFYSHILRRPLSDARFLELCQQFSEAVVDQVMRANEVLGTREFLEKHAKRYRCLIISGTPQGELERIIAARDEAKYFSSVHGSPETKDTWVKRLLEDGCFRSQETVFVGDAMSDWRAATENGLHFVARIHTENKERFNYFHGPTIDNMKSLEQILNTLSSIKVAR